MSIVDGVGIPGCLDCAEIFSIIGVIDGLGGTTGNGTGFISGVVDLDGVVDVFAVVYCCCLLFLHFFYILFFI